MILLLLLLLLMLLPAAVEARGTLARRPRPAGGRMWTAAGGKRLAPWPRAPATLPLPPRCLRATQGRTRRRRGAPVTHLRPTAAGPRGGAAALMGSLLAAAGRGRAPLPGLQEGALVTRQDPVSRAFVLEPQTGSPASGSSSGCGGRQAGPILPRAGRAPGPRPPRLQLSRRAPRLASLPFPRSLATRQRRGRARGQVRRTPSSQPAGHTGALCSSSGAAACWRASPPSAGAAASPLPPSRTAWTQCGRSAPTS
mmetsp:Transcript_39316/g.93136  ORF Transcript_39316/g.93136 Transcript_39316/m.93136 type:complete len:254 (-) Transcript_39316:2056-2817(-)